MSEYLLSVQTPQGEVFKGPVSFLAAAGQAGEVGILGQHAPMIIALKRGLLKVNAAEGEKFFVHESGILEVKPNHDVLILVDDAHTADSKEDAVRKLVVR